jgi:hypothetical protein
MSILNVLVGMFGPVNIGRRGVCRSHRTCARRRFSAGSSKASSVRQRDAASRLAINPPPAGPVAVRTDGKSGLESRRKRPAIATLDATYDSPSSRRQRHSSTLTAMT